MVTDPISAMITSIKNAAAVKKETVTIPYSKMLYSIADLLLKKGFVSGVEKHGKDIKKSIIITLMYYPSGKSRISEIKRLSKTSARMYLGYRDVHPVQNGIGMVILSTPKGILNDALARKEKVGGEAILSIW